MAVVIDSGPITAEHRLRDVPREKWRDLMIARRYFMQVNISYDCRCLVQFIEDAKVMYAALGYANVEDMVRKGYELEPAEIAVAVEWLQLNPSDEPIPIDVATMGGWGGARTKGQKQGVPHTLTRGTGNRAYILARLDRDRPDLAARVRAGELKAKVAGRTAGFIDPLPTPLERIFKLLPKLTADERAQLRNMLAETGRPDAPADERAHA